MFKERKNTSLLAFGSLFSAMLAVSSHAALIEVTTTQDHFGEDNTTCSLREAIQASLTKETFSGCVAGERNITDVIKLKDNATYQLNSELKIDRQIDGFVRTVRIDGSDSFEPTSRDTVTGLINKRLRPTPTIKAAFNHRVFNTSSSGLPLAINNVNIVGSESSTIEYGGAFLVGGSLSLNNVTVKKAHAKNGGAIFLEGTDSSVEMQQTLLENNQAVQGAVLSEFCFDDLSFDRRRIDIKNTSIVNNRAAPENGKHASIIKTCGAPKVTIENSSLANNNSGDKGALLDFSDVRIFDSGAKTNTPELTIDFSTLAGNQNGIRYSEAGSLRLRNNIIAFNTDFDCQFVVSPNAKENNRTPTLNKDAKVATQNNLFEGVNTRGDVNPCDLPQLTNQTADQSNSYIPQTSLLSDYFVSSTALDYGLGLKGLLPKVANIESSNSVPEVLIEAVDSKCVNTDMRGLSRNIKQTSSTENRSCYKGALERGRLIAINDISLSNFSYDDYVTRMQDSIDAEPKSEFSSDELRIFNEVKRQNQALLQGYKDSYDRSKNTNVANFTGYRQVYVSVLENDIPYETDDGKIVLFPFLKNLNSDSSYNVLDANNYQVTVDLAKSGIGSDDDKKDGTITPDDSLFCRWDNTLQQIIIWRRNTVTPAGNKDYCHYTISYTDKTGKTVKSSAYAKASIVNLAPIAKNLTLDTSGTEERIDIDLEASEVINDLADGPNRPLNDNGKEAFPEFFQTPEGVSRYIEIVKQPELGRLAFSGESGNCPNANANQTSSSICYSGKITYIRDNLNSKFDDSFTYRVYDSGNNGAGQGALPSNVATVSINAKRSIGTTSVFKGGGSTGIFTLFGLFGLLAVGRYNHRASTRK